MTKIEELFQLAYKHGLSLNSKPAPHDKWMISVTKIGAVIIRSDIFGGTSDMELCTVTGDSPEEAASKALVRIKEHREVKG